MLPAKLRPRLGCIADENVNFGRTKIAPINLDQDSARSGIKSFLVNPRSYPFDSCAYLSKRLLHKFAHGMGFPGREDVVVGLGCCTMRHIPST